MKKLIDELKNLNTEYTVSKNFRKKVMDKIRKENKENVKEKSNIIYFYRYATALTSAAAVIIVVVMLTKNNFVDVATQQDDARSMGILSNNYSLESSDMLLAQPMEEASSETKVQMAMKDSFNENENLQNLQNILETNNITIVEKEEGYIIVKSKKEELEKILVGIEYEIEILEDGNIKINF